MLKDKEFQVSYFGLPRPQHSVYSARRSRFRCRPGNVISVMLTLALLWMMFQRNHVKQPVVYLPHDLVVAPGNVKDWDTIDQIFAFGDSYTAYFYEERLKNPPFLVNKMRQGNKFRMKPNWITFLIEEHNQSTIQTVNFAEGGSVVDHDIVKPGGFGTSLQKQVEGFTDEYDNGASPAVKWSSDTSLFVVWFGINDILGFYQAQGNKKEYTPLDLGSIFDSYSDALETLYDHGARHFVTLTVPPFDRATNPLGPEAMRVALIRNYVRDISAFNARLYELIGNFGFIHDDVSASVFDTHRLYSRVLDDPQQFEQTKMVLNTVDLCWDEGKATNRGVFDVDYEENICTDGNLVQNYAWYIIHATYPMHNVTAAKIAQDCFGERRPGSYCS